MEVKNQRAISLTTAEVDFKFLLFELELPNFRLSPKCPSNPHMNNFVPESNYPLSCLFGLTCGVSRVLLVLIELDFLLLSTLSYLLIFMLSLRFLETNC